MNERSEQSRKVVKKYMWLSMGVVLIPVPIIDLLALTGVQLKMVSTLAKKYGISFSKDAGKAAIGSLVSSVYASSISKIAMSSTVKSIPIVGTLAAPLLMPLFSGALTYALGIVFIHHFEAGGTLLDFDPEKTREFFKEKFEEGIEEARRRAENNET